MLQKIKIIKRKCSFVLYLSYHTKIQTERKHFRMASITQDMRIRLAVIDYSNKYGVTKAARRYKTNRQYIYRWKNRYDGTWDSLRDRSRRPHHHPNQHTEAEIKLINNMRHRNPNAGLVNLMSKCLIQIKEFKLMLNSHLLTECPVNEAKGLKFYQYTAIDEYSR